MPSIPIQQKFSPKLSKSPPKTSHHPLSKSLIPQPILTPKALNLHPISSASPKPLCNPPSFALAASPPYRPASDAMKASPPVAQRRAIRSPGGNQFRKRT